MADWDADGPQLQANPAKVLDDVTRWTRKRGGFSVAAFKRWHRRTMAGLHVPQPKFVGRFRGELGLEEEPVYIGSCEGTKAALVIGEVNAFVRRLQAVSKKLDEFYPGGKDLDRDGLRAVIELAAWTHSDWARIHPFRNGNGRTARMLTNAILMRYGLPEGGLRPHRSGSPRVSGQRTYPASSSALPPAAVVFTVTVRSTQKRTK